MGQAFAMTAIYITIDTEYEPGYTARKGTGSRRANFERSIACSTPDGEVGIVWQMDKLDEHGLKAVFFVDPMPALLWGVEAIRDAVGPIVKRGHGVQLHIHTEWLALAGAANPLGDRVGVNIKDFTLDEQKTLLSYAIDTLMAAGAPRPIAFRAGNYGANDDTLRALAELGLTHDTSHNPGFADSACDIGLGPDDSVPMRHCGVTEVPVSCIGEVGGALRHTQITAVSLREMKAAIRHARDSGIASLTLVSHSFELLSRRRNKINTVVCNRFEKLCQFLEHEPGIETATYVSKPPLPAPMAVQDDPPVLPANPIRTGLRQVEQAVSNALFGGA